VNDFPFLTVAGLIPLVGAIVVALTPRNNVVLPRLLALGFSLLPLVVIVAMAFQFDPASTEAFQFAESYEWIPAFGVSFSLGVDGIGLALMAMAASLIPFVILASWSDPKSTEAGGTRTFFALVLVLETMILWVFAATDVFLFYVLFEAMLIPVYFLIGRFGGPQRSYAAVKFLLYSLFGGLLMLAAVIGLYVVSRDLTGAGTFELAALRDLSIDPTLQKWMFAGFFIAFAIKAPLWPFHTWLPDAAAQATPGTAVLLVAVLDKVGTFGMIRFCLQLFPDASKTFALTISVLAVIGIIYGALVAIGQTDIMRLIAYTSLSHFGFIILGIFAFTTQSQTGAVFYMVAHGFSTAALFLMAGFMIRRGGSRNIADYGGVFQKAPLFAGAFLIAGLSGLALPGLASFIGEFVTFVGVYVRYPALAIISTLAIVLSAVYILWLYQRVATGEPRGRVTGTFAELTRRETVAMVPILGLTIALGVFPQTLVAVIEPTVATTLEEVGEADPPPDVAPGSVPAVDDEEGDASHSEGDANNDEEVGA
jgi:NADH-quinone oxidoreductase subunit M